jgi:SAM-dependent methyltransferase
LDTDTAWEQWGAQDPYYGVLTDQRFRSAALTRQAKEDFFASGTVHAEYVIGTCRRYVAPTLVPQRILDFGCGVGRLVIPFAAIAPEVVGVDVSSSMLNEAKRNCEERGASNVSLVLSDDTLSAVQGQFDLVHSCIVLQHISIERGRALFALLVDRIKTGGCGAIQITFAWDLYANNFGRAPKPPAVPTIDGFDKSKAYVRRILESMILMEPRPAPVTCYP